MLASPRSPPAAARAPRACSGARSAASSRSSSRSPPTTTSPALIARYPALGWLALGADRAPGARRARRRSSASSGAFRRLARIDGFRAEAAAALATADRDAALALVAPARALLRRPRPSCAGTRERLAEQRDGAARRRRARSQLTERDAARAARRRRPAREIEAASRTVAAATALDPARARRRAGRAVAERADGPPHRRGLRRPCRLLRLLAAARAWSRPTCSPPARSRSATT